MNPRQWFGKWLSSIDHSRRLSTQRPPRARLQVECLEPRCVPSIVTLATFDGTNGADPVAGVIEDSSGNLFGTTVYESPTFPAALGDGSVFEVQKGSGAITTLASFDGTNGSNPFTGLVEDINGNLFGTISNGGAFNDGTVFEVPNGLGSPITLASFDGTDGSAPETGMVLDSSGNLFGTTAEGGVSGVGTVFEVPKGSGSITTLASFSGPNGALPYGLIEDSSGNLFGTASFGGVGFTGGATGDGTVFEIVQGSSTITVLASFNGTTGINPGVLALDGSGNLFGSAGSASGYGMLFEIKNGSGTITPVADFTGTNMALPYGSLVVDGSGNLYSVTTYNAYSSMAGYTGDGAVFEVQHGSSTITTIALFDGDNGANPQGGLIEDTSGNLYGTTDAGSAQNAGTVFEVPAGLAILPPSLPDTTLGRPYNQTITAARNTGTVTFSTAGTLPAGLTLSKSGVLSGTSTTAGTYQFTVTATDMVGASDHQAYTVTINPAVTITTSTLANGTINQPGYSQTISATGGTGSLTFTTTAGTVPIGLTLSSSGELSGTPAAAGSFSFTVTATDAVGAAASQSYTVMVNPIYTVDRLTDLGQGSGLAGDLRYCIDQAASGDTITFGVQGTITLTGGELAIDKDLTIAGPGADLMTISGNHASGVFNIEDAFNVVAISGVSIADGFADQSFDGGILNAGTLTLTNCILSGNNEAIFNPGTLTITNSTLSGNGEAISNYVGATLAVTNSTLSGNTARAIFNSGTVTITNSTLSDNSAVIGSSSGGAIENDNPGTVTITVSTLSGNSASNAGAILNEGGGTITITDSILSDNSAIGLGGGAEGGGGAITNGGTLTISTCTLSANSAGGFGGGAILNYHTLTISNCTLSGNSASGGGSGTAAGGGGAIANGGTLTITNSTLSGNYAGGLGGGGILNNGTATITYCTLSGNYVGGLGGGVNSRAGAATSLRNTIVAGTFFQNPDTYGNFASQGHNLIGDGSGGSGFDSTDLVGTASNPIDPMLGPLENNGGPTPTMALLPGSPALGAGDPTTAPPWDQRGPGFPRVVNGKMDIGAFEVQMPPAISTTSLPNWTVNQLGYSQTISATGGTGSLTFATTAGTLPTGLILSSGGVLAGTPTATGSYTFTVTATDAVGASASQSYKVTILPPAFSQYLVTVVGASTVQAGIPFQVTVQAADPNGNPVTSYSGPATVTATISPVSAASNFPITVPINNNGLGFFLANMQKAGSYTITVASGSFTGSAAAITVTPGPAVKLAFSVQPVNTPTGDVLPPLTVQIEDLYGNVVTNDNTDHITVGIAAGPDVFKPGSTVTGPVNNGVATFSNLTLVTPGTYQLSAIVPGLYTGSFSSIFNVIPLQVLPGSFVGTPWGFSLQLNAPCLINAVTPALYGSGSGAGAAVTPTVSLTQTTGTPPAGNTLPYQVPGSLIVNSTINALTFVETDTASVVNNGTPLLPDGIYVVHISSSGVNGLQALNSGGGYLDGANTGTPGHDFTATFTVGAAGAGDDVLWVPATADGPGQALSAPGMNKRGGGYPVYLDSTGGVTTANATLSYNPALLTVTPATTATFTVTVPRPGTALLHYSGPALAAGGQTAIGFITAGVPAGTTAKPTPYKAKDLLLLSAVSLNGGATAVVTSDGMHLVAYVGDANGDGAYSSDDALRITRVVLQTDTGFTAYPLVDPIIVADTDGSGFIPADAALQVNEAGVGVPTVNLPVPPIPSGVVFQAIAHRDNVRAADSGGTVVPSIDTATSQIAEGLSQTTPIGKQPARPRRQADPLTSPGIDAGELLDLAWHTAHRRWAWPWTWLEAEINGR